MATATFGRRNTIKPGTAPLSRRSVEALRKTYSDLSAPVDEGQVVDRTRAFDPSSARKLVIAALALIGIAVLLLTCFLTELRRDAALIDTFRLDPSISVERASCRRYLFLVTSCSVQLSWRGAGTNTRQIADTRFLVGLKSMGGLMVMPVRSSADATVVTTAVALKNLPNRMWTLASISGGCLLLGVLMLLKLRRGQTQ
jgi:hypothetical protein